MMLLLPIGLLAPVAGAMLDGIATSLALSTRRLRSAYAGPALRVRRSADSLELDVGFDSAGDLDTVSLLGHCGAGHGFVAAWYDQSGGANHVAQPAAANQPRIVNAGSLDLFKAGGRPAPAWTGVSMGLSAALATGGAAVSAFAAASTEVSDTVSRRIASYQASGQANDYSNASSAALLYRLNGSLLTYRSGPSPNPGGAVAAGPVAAAVVFNGVTAQVRANGVALQSLNSTGNFGPSGTLIIGNSPLSEFWIGSIGELIIQASAGAGDRAAIEASQRLYWGTP